MARVRYAADTSVAIAALDETHEAHAPTLDAVARCRPALAGHAAWETFSVLTRLPGQLRVTAAVAHDVIRRSFPDACWLDSNEQAALFGRLPVLGITGSSIYDALVGAAAMSEGRRLLSRDRRADRTYSLLGVDVEFVD
ncbi:MAG: type II toxin-antitoxin system VapC family toxin [Actinobacteria bacterium]|nr:type II toxin-antitoxin system VapC family toxin [Actinomycetota bacterium]